MTVIVAVLAVAAAAVVVVAMKMRWSTVLWRSKHIGNIRGSTATSIEAEAIVIDMDGAEDMKVMKKVRAVQMTMTAVIEISDGVTDTIRSTEITRPNTLITIGEMVMTRGTAMVGEKNQGNEKIGKGPTSWIAKGIKGESHTGRIITCIGIAELSSVGKGRRWNTVYGAAMKLAMMTTLDTITVFRAALMMVVNMDDNICASGGLGLGR